MPYRCIHGYECERIDDPFFNVTCKPRLVEEPAPVPDIEGRDIKPGVIIEWPNGEDVRITKPGIVLNDGTKVTGSDFSVTLPRSGGSGGSAGRGGGSGVSAGVNPKDVIGDTKAPLHLVPPALTIAAAEALANGAKKYGPFNWREYPVQAHAYYAAALRHLTAWWDGEDDASDSGISHLAHAVAGLSILLDSIALGILQDDRPTTGPTAALLERLAS